MFYMILNCNLIHLLQQSEKNKTNYVRHIISDLLIILINHRKYTEQCALFGLQYIDRPILYTLFSASIIKKSQTTYGIQ